MSEAVKPSNRLAALDLLRTVAIVWVFFWHLRSTLSLQSLQSVGRFGWMGVDLFFVLSGFLITNQLLKNMEQDGQISFKSFYLRRGLRIWPNYVLVLLIYFCLPAFAEHSTLPSLWKFLTFTQNFDLDFVNAGAFSHAWSLCVEEQFYLVLPVVLLWVWRQGNTRFTVMLFSGVLVSGVIVRFLLWKHFLEPLPPGGERVSIYLKQIYYPTYCRMDGLIVGVAIAGLVRRRPQLWERLGRRGNWWMLLGGVCLAGACALFMDRYSLAATVLGYPLVAIGFGGILMAALSSTSALARCRIPGTEWGATLAFSFYLTHKQMIHLVRGWLEPVGIEVNTPLGLIAIVVGCLGASVALYLLIERPFLRLREGLSQRGPRESVSDKFSKSAIS